MNRKHDLDWEKYKQEKAKEGETVFKPNKYRADLFNTNKDVMKDYEITRTVSILLFRDISLILSLSQVTMKENGRITMRIAKVYMGISNLSLNTWKILQDKSPGKTGVNLRTSRFSRR